MAVETGLFKSLVLFTLPKPIIDLSMPETVPVNVGLSNGAFIDKLLATSVVLAFKFILFDKVPVSVLFNFKSNAT